MRATSSWREATPVFSEEALDVVLHGEGRDDEPRRDLRVRKPLGEQRRDLALARGHGLRVEILEPPGIPS